MILQTASIVSPFSQRYTTNDWIIWQQSEALNLLQLPSNTDCKSAETDHQSHSVNHQNDNASYTPVQIQRPQYNAVLERFSRADKMKGMFSNWVT